MLEKSPLRQTELNQYIIPNNKNNNDETNQSLLESKEKKQNIKNGHTSSMLVTIINTIKLCIGAGMLTLSNLLLSFTVFFVE